MSNTPNVLTIPADTVPTLTVADVGVQFGIDVQSSTYGTSTSPSTLAPNSTSTSEQPTAVPVVFTRSVWSTTDVTLATITITQSARFTTLTTTSTNETVSSVGNATSQSQSSTTITTSLTSEIPPPMVTNESSNSSGNDRVRQLTAAAIAAPTAVVLVLLVAILVFFCLRRRRRQRAMATQETGATRNGSKSRIRDTNVYFLNPRMELDSTHRHETDARVCKQELGTDRGGGNRGHATGMERIVKRLIGKTAELDGSQGKKEKSIVKGLHELEA